MVDCFRNSPLTLIEPLNTGNNKITPLPIRAKIMKTNKILQKLDYEFSEAIHCQVEQKKQLNKARAKTKAEEKELHKKLQKEGNKRKRKLLNHKLHLVAQAQAMIRKLR